MSPSSGAAQSSAAQSSAAQHWAPSSGLVDDLHAVLSRAPRQTPEDRFEAWAWAALVDSAGPEFLTRRARPGHLTASAIVLSPDARRTCLVLHGKFGFWVQPGGHLEPGDLTIGGAAAREVREETGLTGHLREEIVVLSRHRAPCRPDNDWHFDVQFVLVSSSERPTVSEESRDVRWWEVDDLPADLADGVVPGLERARRIVLGPLGPLDRR